MNAPRPPLHTRVRSSGPGSGRSRTPSGPGRRGRGDGGSALAEFALTLPILAVIVLGTIDVGRAFSMKNRLTNMAREGAFYAQYHPFDVTGCAPTSITQVALNEDPTFTSTFPGTTVTVSNADTGVTMPNACGAVATPGTEIRVQVAAPMRLFTPFVGAVTGDTITVSGGVEVVVQG
jgi:Flp pilus assembly protein TadG